MKFTIETELFKAEATTVDTAMRLLNLLSEPVPVLDNNNDDDLSADTYLTITVNDITIGGKSTTEYNGNEIWSRNDCIEYVKEASELFEKECGASLAELHVVQANNVAGKPIPDTNGKYAWFRCVFDVNGEKKVTPWVFRYALSSVADCGSYCASHCGNFVRYNSAFRAGVFGSLGA